MPVVPFIPAIVGGASALLGAKASKDASKAQVQAADRSAEMQLQMYNQTRSDLAPYMQTGNQAMSQLAKLFGLGAGGTGVPDTAAMQQALTQFPGYQFGLNQGQQALDRSAASRGMVLSGAQLQDSQTFGQNYAMQQAWAPYVSQLNQLAGMGQNSAAGVGTQGQQAAQGAGAAYTQAGQARADGALGTANQIVGGIQSIYGGLKDNNVWGLGGNTYTKGAVDGLSGGLKSTTGWSLSDARVKEDIQRVGQTDDGLGVYLYRFKGSPKTEMGVMAQEVARKKPDAVALGDDGLLRVNYGAISPLAALARAA